MKSQILQFKSILLLLLIVSLNGQPKLSVDLGTGFYEPTMKGFDSNELVSFPTGNILTRNLLINFSTFYEFFPNARVGYSVLKSIDIGRLEGFANSKPVFYRTINYRMIPLETFFRLKPKVELNFTLTPIWGRGRLTLETKPASSDGGGVTITDDWNELLNSFGDDSPLEQVASDNAMVADWFGYSGMLGYRYYIRPWIGIDFKMGFFLLSGGVIGSTLGVNLFKLLKTYGQIDIVIQFLFIIFLGFIGMSMAFESAKTTIKNYRTTSAIRTKLHQHSWIHGLPFKLRFHRSKLYISAIPPILIGFFVGVLSAMMGVGGGFIMIPAMVYILGMSTNVVVGTSLFQIIFVTANSTFFQSYINQTVDIVLSALMILGGVIGAQIGVRLGSQLKAEYLRGILAILVLLVCAKILTDLILTPSDLFSTSLN